jgi:ABC-type spermidine/putrescine transport system permease subunit I
MVIWLNKTTLVVYNACLTIAIYFSEYFGSTERDAIIKNVGKYEYIAEHQFLIESIQNLSRIIAYALFVVIGLMSSMFAFKVLLMILICANPVKYLIMKKQRKIRKEFEIINAAKANA